MIRYALICGDCESEFEAWFSSSAAFDSQKESGLISCAHCHGQTIEKAVMAPAVSGTKKSTPADPEALFRKFAAKARQHVSDNFEYVGQGFASEARAMHSGESDPKPIWGETTSEERAALKEEGVETETLHPAFVPQPQVDKDRLN